MLSFKMSSDAELARIVSDCDGSSLSYIGVAISASPNVFFASVDGSHILRLVGDDGASTFTFPTGVNWQNTIALLVTYTREHYLPIVFSFVPRCSVNDLLTMFPGCDAEIKPERADSDLYRVTVI